MIKNIAASIRQRLLNLAKQRDKDKCCIEESKMEKKVLNKYLHENIF